MAEGAHAIHEVHEGGSSEQTGRPALGNAAAVADALRYVPNEDAYYDRYIDIGMALKGALGEEGRLLYHEWASCSQKYHPDDTEARWNSFKPHSIGAGSLFYWAAEWLARCWNGAPHEAQAPHWPRHKVDGRRADRNLRRIIRTFFNQIERWLGRRDELRARMPPRICPRTSLRLLKRDRAPAWPPTAGIQIKASAGLGKSTAIVQQYLNRPSLWTRHINLYVPAERPGGGVPRKIRREPRTRHGRGRTSANGASS